MDPFQNGYLAPRLYPHFFCNFYQPTNFSQMGYNYSLQMPFPNSQQAVSVYEPTTAHNQPFLEGQDKQNLKGPMLSFKKRPTKRLSLVKFQKNIEKISQYEKVSARPLNYFDPSRAPVITTLRSRCELQSDLKNYGAHVNCSKDSKVYLSDEDNEEMMKLKLIDSIPSSIEYPFLICKRRKYYRNLKRRYSVSFLRKRAEFIKNKIPIPPQFEPKHKNRSRELSSQSSHSDFVVQSNYQSSPSDREASQSGRVVHTNFNQNIENLIIRSADQEKNLAKIFF